MIEFANVVRENGNEEVMESIKDVVSAARAMLEAHREYKDKSFRIKALKLIGKYEDKDGQIMADILGCCKDISDNIENRVYTDYESTDDRLASDISELAHLIYMFMYDAQNDMSIDVFANALLVYNNIVKIFKGMVIGYGESEQIKEGIKECSRDCQA